METTLICLAAFGASLLTFVSGFGLGTLLLPVFALFFPVDLAVLLTAVVHLFNNIFKFLLLRAEVIWPVFWAFGLPSMIGAGLGAWCMIHLGSNAPLFNGVVRPVGPLDLVIATLMALFGVVELTRSLDKHGISPRWIIPGGLLSGFLGGLSGHQGALRSLFLLRTPMDKVSFIATGVAIACVVDLTRIPGYLMGGVLENMGRENVVLLAATLSAFGGALLGRRLMPKVPMTAVRTTVGVLLLVIAVMLAAGLI